ncbi:hypothetical protein D1B31_13760 [Neobacillus notoginsengisoli]|uniref:Uncharacterized protein n=1 Tax=Neobacillus notoginsengisoli TaxID=1578198 RepID=A0A417YSP9_9BACI|nr:hypothetical protein [Neobacillus notoginsengisoli]RHW39024.1 hypothetical protein D1B31_13760 [Neobacillus notoginsengisoli]
MAETTFLKTDHVLVTNVRIETKKKLILVNSVAMVAKGTEKIDRPWVLLGLAALSMLALPPSELTGYHGIGLGVLFAMFGGFAYFYNESHKRDAIIITLNTGEKTYIFEDLEQVYKAVQDAIVYRAQ